MWSGKGILLPTGKLQLHCCVCPRGKGCGPGGFGRGGHPALSEQHPVLGGRLFTSESHGMTNPGDLSIPLRETPGNRQCRMASASSTLCPPTPCRPCHPARVASPNWSRGALPSTGAQAGDLPCLGLSLIRCMPWRICTTHQDTPPRPHIPSPPSPQCPTTCPPRQCPSPQKRGQMPLPFRTLLRGPKKTGAWCGGRTSAAEPTEGWMHHRTSLLLFHWGSVSHRWSLVWESLGTGFSK